MSGISTIVAAQLAQAAYPNSGTILPTGWVAQSTKTTSDGNNSFTVFVNSTTNQIVISFKGSDTASNFQSDLANSGGSAWEAIMPLANTALAALTAQGSPYANYSIVTDGHSLGGGMAQTFALENNLSGYGFNSLPISQTAIGSDTNITTLGLTGTLGVWTTNGNTFSETNVSGDPATLYYSSLQGQTYLNTTTTTLQSPYAAGEIAGGILSITPFAALGVAMVADCAANAHSIGTVINLLNSNTGSTTGDTSAVSSNLTANATAIENAFSSTTLTTTLAGVLATTTAGTQISVTPATTTASTDTYSITPSGQAAQTFEMVTGTGVTVNQNGISIGVLSGIQANITSSNDTVVCTTGNSVTTSGIGENVTLGASSTLNITSGTVTATLSGDAVNAGSSAILTTASNGNTINTNANATINDNGTNNDNATGSGATLNINGTSDVANVSGTSNSTTVSGWKDSSTVAGTGNSTNVSGSGDDDSTVSGTSDSTTVSGNYNVTTVTGWKCSTAVTAASTGSTTNVTGSGSDNTTMLGTSDVTNVSGNYNITTACGSKDTSNVSGTGNTTNVTGSGSDNTVVTGTDDATNVFGTSDTTTIVDGLNDAVNLNNSDDIVDASDTAIQIAAGLVGETVSGAGDTIALGTKDDLTIDDSSNVAETIDGTDGDTVTIDFGSGSTVDTWSSTGVESYVDFNSSGQDDGSGSGSGGDDGGDSGDLGSDPDDGDPDGDDPTGESASPTLKAAQSKPAGALATAIGPVAQVAAKEEVIGSSPPIILNHAAAAINATSLSQLKPTTPIALSTQTEPAASNGSLHYLLQSMASFHSDNVGIDSNFMLHGERNESSYLAVNHMENHS